MKRYISTATDRSNKMTQTKSQKFTRDDVMRNANNVRRGETMSQIVHNILNDPDIELGTPDSEGNEAIIYKGKNIGWINKRRGIGDINNKAYTQIKHAAQARRAQSVEDTSVDEEVEEDLEEDDEEELEEE